MRTPDPSEIDDLLDLGISRAFGAPGRDGEMAPMLAELAAAEPPVVEALPEQIGRFRVLGLIAQGGMGIVVRAEDPGLEREVAIKYMRRNAAGVLALQQLFRGEARVMGRLQHPGVVPVHEVGTMEDGRHFYVMKVVTGDSLHDVLAQGQREARDRREALTLFGRVCEAVAFAHDRGVVHGDLKPANVMVGSFGEVQLLDWGFARACADAAAVGCGSDVEPDAPRVLGTPGYMAPEQARGMTEAIDRRTDVFALGSILCEILTGAPAYRGANRDEVYLRARKAWLDDAFKRLDASVADPALVALARSCLAEEQAARPADARALATAIHAHLTAVERRAQDAAIEAAQARAKAAEERKARRITLALSIVVIVALLGAGAAYWLFQSREAGLRADAEERAQGARQRVLELRDVARAAGHLVEQRWVEATAVAREADALARGPHVSPMTAASLTELHRQVQAEAAAALREGRARRLLETTQPHLGEERPVADVEAGYRELLGVFGVDADRDDPAVVAAAIANSPLATDLAHALHRWAHARRGRADDNDRVRLLRLADAIDQDHWRTELRRCCGARDGDALRALSKAEDVGKQHGESLGLMAECLLSVGDRASAIATYRVAHLHHPGDYAITHDLAALLERLSPRPLEEIARLFSAALALRPNDPHALVDLAATLTERGQLEDARALAERAEAIDAGYPRLWLMLASLRELTGDVAGALEAARKAATRLPDSGMAQILLANQERRAGRLEAARVACERALVLAPALAAAPRALGVIHMDEGCVGAAIGRFRQALELDAGDPEIWYHLGLALSEIRDGVAAEAAYRKAVELRPQYAEAWCNLGSVLANAGRFDEGIAALRRGAEIGEKSPRWSHPTAAWIAAAETRRVEASKLDAILSGEALPSDPARCAALGALAVARGANSLARRLFAAAIRGGAGRQIPFLEPACAAFRIAGGLDLGRTPDAEERRDAAGEAYGQVTGVLAQMRTAVATGQIDLVLLRKIVSTWELSPEFAALREPALGTLPADDAAPWREFWQDLRAFGAEHGLR